MIFTAATGGILVSSLAAERLAKRHPQRTLIIAGFVITLAGVAVLLALVNGSPERLGVRPRPAAIGLGVGVMLTPSVNVVQSSFPEERQGEISGLSRSVSNLGSSLGTAIGGTILVSGLTDPRPTASPWSPWPSSGWSASSPRCSSPASRRHSPLPAQRSDPP